MKTKSDVIVDFFVFQDMGEPIICGVNGAATLDELRDIEKEFAENYQDIGFEKDGNYEIRCRWDGGQYGEYGRCEIAPYWEFNLISYEPIPEEPVDEMMEVGGVIIEGEYQDAIELSAFDNLDGLVWQGNKSLCIDKQQARQLIEALQKWIDGEEIK